MLHSLPGLLLFVQCLLLAVFATMYPNQWKAKVFFSNIHKGNDIESELPIC